MSQDKGEEEVDTDLFEAAALLLLLPSLPGWPVSIFAPRPTLPPLTNSLRLLRLFPLLFRLDSRYPPVWSVPLCAHPDFAPKLICNQISGSQLDVGEKGSKGNQTETGEKQG